METYEFFFMIISNGLRNSFENENLEIRLFKEISWYLNESTAKNDTSYVNGLHATYYRQFKIRRSNRNDKLY
jgi:hypothetical protein